MVVFNVQVNQWLTWLETAEEEESEDEDYWGTDQSHRLRCNKWYFLLYFFLLVLLLTPNVNIDISSTTVNIFFYKIFSHFKPASPFYLDCASLYDFWVNSRCLYTLIYNNSS